MREPITQVVTASEARREWSELLNKVFRKEERVIVEKSGTPVAAIISVEDLERFNRFEARRRERFKALEDSWDAHEDDDPAEIEHEVSRAILAVRAESRRSE